MAGLVRAVFVVGAGVAQEATAGLAFGLRLFDAAHRIDVAAAIAVHNTQVVAPAVTLPVTTTEVNAVGQLAAAHQVGLAQTDAVVVCGCAAFAGRRGGVASTEEGEAEGQE